MSMVTFIFHLNNLSGKIPVNGTICSTKRTEKDNPFIVFFASTPVSGGNSKLGLGLGLGLGFPVLIISIIAAGYWRLRKKATQKRKQALADARQRIGRDPSSIKSSGSLEGQ